MEDFVPYELAVKLKEKGFNIECYAAYYEPIKHCINYLNFSSAFYIKSLAKEYNFIAAPTISQVLKWLREEQLIHICIGYDGVYSYDIVGIIDCEFIGAEDGYETYELAAIAGIEYIIDNDLI